MHVTAAQWIADFETTVNTKGPTEIAHLLVMLGADNPKNPAVGEGYAGGVLDWIAKNPQTFNTAIHRVLLSRPGLVSKLRRVIRTDLTRAEGSNYKIASIPYAQALLDNFLTARPNPAWVEG